MAAASETEAEVCEFEQNVQAIQEGLDAVDQGRVHPLEEFLAEHRQWYPDALKPCAKGHGY